jgi:hypothetical protein
MRERTNPPNCSKPVARIDSRKLKMMPRIPEKNKKPGVCYAVTDDGIELPVIDVTNPIFTENASQQELAALSDDFLHFQKSPAFFRRFFSQRSIAMRGLEPASGKFLGGMTTYVAKLGPDILGKGYAGLIDRKVASGIGSVSFRIRLQAMAHLIADELAPMLAARKGCSIHLLNIGGGPAMDSLNALILIQKEHPDWLGGRRICIHVLDLDAAGPSFGSRAMTGLLAEGAPLQGLEITLAHVTYDWARVSELQKTVTGIDTDDVVLSSSEGGLFEYGSNEVIVENLKALRDGTPACFVMVGSILRDVAISRWIQATSKMSLRTFELEDFRTLVGSAGWVIERVIEGNPLYQVVSLEKAQTHS